MSGEAEINVFVVHETDGRKYLEALEVLAREQKIASVSFYGASVLWRFAHAILRDRMKLRRALGIALDNLWFHLRLGSVRDATVIIAVAPWDFRLPWLAWRFRNNRIIYNTSWPWWTDNRVPRRYGLFTPLMRRAFRASLSRPDVSVVTVTPGAAASLMQFVPGVQTTVISHMVSEVFFARRAQHRLPFRLLFVGELLEKKGFRDFLEICKGLGDEIEVEIVGDGPLHALAELARKRPGWRWHGKVTDRARLAAIVADCQLFLSLPHRTPRWEELFGMAVAEAMAAGVPCIVHDHVGPAGIIQHGQNGFLATDGDTDAVCNWISLLTNEPERWQAVADAAVETARRFSMASISRQWCNVLTGAPATLNNLSLVLPPEDPLTSPRRTSQPAAPSC